MQQYLFYSLAGLGISWLLYYFILRREKCLKFNRFFLLGSLFLCQLAPLLELEMGSVASIVPEIDFSEMVTPAAPQTEEGFEGTVISQVERESNLLPKVLISLYLVVTTAFLFRFLKNLRQIILQIRKNKSIKVKGLRVLPVKEKGNPFSFFHYLFLNKEDMENKDYSALVFNHEAAHSKEYHSADVLLLELFTCFLWPNPFIWLYKKAIITNHEYLADAAVVNMGVDIASYSSELIQAGNNNKYFHLISGFNFIQTKRRLLMLHSEGSSKVVRILKTSLVTILLIPVLVLSSFKANTEVAYLSETELKKDEVAEQAPVLESLPFAIVDEVPVFPGCEELNSMEARKICFYERITDFVNKNIDEKAIALYTQPRSSNVHIQFRINEVGRVSKVRARATSPKLNAEDKAILEREAIEVINALPQMRPGKENGKVVGVFYLVRL